MKVRFRISISITFEVTTPPYVQDDLDTHEP